MIIGLLENLLSWGVEVRRVGEFFGGGGTLNDSSSSSRQAKVARAGVPNREVSAKARGREERACLRDGRKAGVACLPLPQCGRCFAFLCLISTETKKY